MIAVTLPSGGYRHIWTNTIISRTIDTNVLSMAITS